MGKKILFILLVFAVFTSVSVKCYCQQHTQELDSLYAIIKSTPPKNIKPNHLIRLSSLLNDKNESDYNEIFNQIEAIAMAKGNDTVFAHIGYNKMMYLREKGKMDEAIAICKKCLQKISYRKNPALYTMHKIELQDLYFAPGNYKEGIEAALEFIKEAEVEKDTANIIYATSDIGSGYNDMGQLQESIKWLLKADNISHQKKYDETKAGCALYLNLASDYLQLKQIDSALYYSNISIDECKKYNIESLLATSLAIKGQALSLTNNTGNAELILKEALYKLKQQNSTYFYTVSLSALASVYKNTGRPFLGITSCKEALAILDSNENLMPKEMIFRPLAECYKAAKQYEQYGIVMDSLMKFTEATYRKNSASSIAEMKIKYDVQKQETLIAEQKLSLFTRKILLYSAGVLVLFIFLYSIYQFKKYQQRQKIIEEQKRKQAEGAVKDAEEKERKRIAAELHDNLGVQANAILHNSSLLNLEKESNKNVVTDLQETAKEMLLNLRETLWAMKTSDVPATDLWLRIINFMKQMGRHYTTLNFALEGTPPNDFIIPSTKALNIVLVLQETVNNAVKHAQAKTITAKSVVNNGIWQLLIEDDGKGFNIEDAKQKNDSYGLTNMQERAKSGGFIYALQSELGKGTITTITI
jgi:signal transduction histidine kinase